MDCEDKYKNALERAKKLYEQGTITESISYIFPELKESEDERMRRELVAFLKEELDTGGRAEETWDMKGLERWIKWLEKQGEQKPWSEGDEQNLNACLGYIPDEFLRRWLKDTIHIKYDKTSLSEEDEDAIEMAIIAMEDKYVEDEKIRKDIIRILKGEISYTSKEENEKYIAWLEKQGEQNPANKVEPKFKVGDWITNGHCTHQITFVDSRYWYSETCVLGNVIDIDKTFHLWTIEDAKDGDVLVSQYNSPFIYNGNHNSFHIGSYCGISVVDMFKVATEKCFWAKNVNIYPSTKEQRDLLFSKIREAGYEWDSKEKELKKIEQKGGEG